MTINHTNQKLIRHAFFKKVVMTLVFIAIPFVNQRVFPAPDYYQFDRIGLDEGLAHSNVNCITQDQYGFMWFATKGGLQRYDGSQLKLFCSDPNDSTSLSGDEVTVLFVDSRRNLWVATTNGLHRYQFNSESFVRYAPPRRDELFRKLTYITSIAEDKSGHLWIGTWSNGLFRFDPVTEMLTSISLEDKPVGRMYMNTVFNIYSNRSDSVWIVSNQHNLSILNTQTNEQTDYQYLEKGRPYHEILRDRKGRLWSGPMARPLIRVDLSHADSPKYISYPEVMPNENFTAMLEDRDGNFWLGTSQDGIILFNPDTNEQQHLRHHSLMESSIINSEIIDIYEDRVGNIWVATNKGVSKWARWRKPFRHFRYNTDDPSSISGDDVTGISEDKYGNVWISTINDGICRFNPVSEKFERHHVRNSRLGVNWTVEILAARNGDLWVGTNWMGGLQRFDFQRDRVTFYQHNPQDSTSIGFNVLNTLFEDSQGRLWIGPTNRGLNRFDPVRERFVRYIHDQANPSTLSGNNVLSMAEDSRGRLWIGTDNGISLYNEISSGFRRYLNVANPSAGLHHGRHMALQQSDNRLKIYSMYVDQTDQFWLGTNDGLMLFDREQGVAAEHPANDHLTDTAIYGILEDDSSYLWLQQVNGIVRVNPKTSIVVEYDREDGWIQTVNFQQEWLHSYAKLNSGEMVFGGSEGITLFDPAQIQDNPYPPAIFITGLDVLYQPIEFRNSSGENRAETDSILTQSILFTNHITLKNTERTFSLEFAALDYTQPNANQYAFMLEGFHDDWIHVGNETKASFTNIPSGSYTFRVKACNNDGLWNEKGAAVTITVLPPWWQTKLAIVIYLLLVVAGFLGVRRIELNRVNMRNQLEMKEFETRKLEEVNQMKSHFFANISHEFRTPLTLILGPLAELIAKTRDTAEKQELQMIQRSANRLLRLINQLLDLSRLETGNVKLIVRQGNIVAFLRGVFMSFASMADMRNITLSFVNKMGKTTDPEPAIYFESDKIEKVFYNLCSNALKYTNDGGRIAMTLKRDHDEDGRDYLQVTVRDNGIGIPADKLSKVFDRFYQVNNDGGQMGAGIGLALTKELVQLHHGFIDVQSEEQVGTEFIVRLPLDPDVYSSEEKDDSSRTITGTTKVNALSIVDDAAPLERDDTATPADQTTLPADNATIVLVVEDHADVRRYIRSHLSDEYHVVEAINGADGVEKAMDIIPDLIVSDVMMPELDGFRMCELLKSNEKTSHIPIILLTARAGEQDKLTGLETGADDYLSKPFNSKELQTRVHNLIDQRRKLRERFRREVLLQPREVTVTSVDEQFLTKLMAEIEEHLGDDSFGVEELAAELHMGRRQLLRKIRALTNQTPTELIRTVRLRRARQLIEQKAGSISEIAYEVGFDNLSYFAKCFKDEFGKLPSEMVGGVTG
ncbi:response regulator [candidate division KSB1 bacterium]|nr:response regulator [candidate division KSB1 bacterium]